MRSALYQLGFHDVYHMHNLINDPSKAPQWVRAFEAKFEGKGTFEKEDWDRLLGDCQGICDLPSAPVAVEVALAYPDAKVVIMNRDPEAWYESVLHSIYTMTKPKQLGLIAQMIYCAIFDQGFRNIMAYSKVLNRIVLPYDHGKEKDKAIAWFNNQYAEYRERIPEERRIEYSIKDGWKPLCDHLGVPVPMVKDEKTGEMVEAPFPRLNDRQSFMTNAVQIRSQATDRATNNFWNMLGKLAMTGAVGYGGFLMWKTRLGGRL